MLTSVVHSSVYRLSSGNVSSAFLVRPIGKRPTYFLHDLWIVSLLFQLWYVDDVELLLTQGPDF